MGPDWQARDPAMAKKYSTSFGTLKLRCVKYRWKPRVIPTPPVIQWSTRHKARAFQLNVKKAANEAMWTPTMNKKAGHFVVNFPEMGEITLSASAGRTYWSVSGPAWSIMV